MTTTNLIARLIDSIRNAVRTMRAEAFSTLSTPRYFSATPLTFSSDWN